MELYLYLYQSCAYIGCAGNIEIWRQCINYGIDFSERYYNSENLIEMRKELKIDLTNYKDSISDFIVVLCPSKSDKSYSAFQLLESQFIETNKLARLAYEMEGSYISYSERVNELYDKAEELGERFKLEKEKMIRK